jgi:UDP-N-acetylglucosamine--N-acetylmuramyl-(pentapeptide) pyrophosphoryl-undecaprenol N-acetylglucosamine transferase
MIKLPKSIFQSASTIKKFSPSLVLGVGGYSAGPVCLMARFMGIPTAIHEQNSYPGLTNRLLSRVVDRAFISFEESRDHFRANSVFLTGNPIREELLSVDRMGAERKKAFTILVVGGSQGATAINKSFAETLEYLNARGKNPEVIHQTGEADYQRVVDDYRERKLIGELSPFIQDMTAAYNRADLVVSRAGATTIFELAALGKPSILIPYPYATNQHQMINARSLARVGGAEMILQSDLNTETLARLLIKYMDDPSALKKMSNHTKKMAHPNAAKVIVDHLLEMIKQ